MKSLILLSCGLLALSIRASCAIYIRPDPSDSYPWTDPMYDKADSDVDNVETFDIEKLKRIAVKNDIQGGNVVSNIKAKETNMRESNSMEDQSDFVEEVIQLQKALTNCKKVAVGVESIEGKAQSEIKKIKNKIKAELIAAKQICNQATPSAHSIAMKTYFENLKNSINRCIKISNKFSGNRIETKGALMEINDELEDEIDHALAINKKIAKKVGGEQLSDELDNDNEMLDDDDELLEDEMLVDDLEKTIADGTGSSKKSDIRRRLGLSNSIKGGNVVSNQDFEEINLPSHYPYGSVPHGRHFYDQDEEENVEDKVSKRKEKSRRMNKCKE